MSKKRSFFKPTIISGNVPSLFRGWKDWKDGDYLIGRYHSRYETEFRKQKQPNYRFEVLDCNFKVKESKDSTKLISPVGKILTLNSAGKLNKFLDGTEKREKVPFKHIAEIVYAGKVPGKDDDEDTEYHDFHKLEAGPEIMEDAEETEEAETTEGKDW